MTAVIFDIGGVLAYDVWENLLLDKSDGIASLHGLDADLVGKVGKLLWNAFAYTPETRGNDWRQLETRYWKSFIEFFWEKTPPDGVTVDAFVDMTDTFIRPVADMESVLEDLRSRGYGLAICSNNNEFWFRRQMDKLRLHRFFSPEKTILSCRIGVAKSSPGFEMFHAAASSLGLEPSRCAFVDDRQGNVERAKELGMQGFLFDNAGQLDDCLRKAGF